VRRFFEGFFTTLHQYLLSPTKILWICAILVVLNLVLDGSLFRLWKLHRDFDQLTVDLMSLQGQSEQLKTQLKKAKDPEFMEREARDRFDLVNEGDLVFVFADN
jgi:cell division protein FtsB